MSLITQRRVVLVKSQTAAGVNPLPDATNAVCVEEITPTAPAEVIESRCSKGTLGPSAPVIGRTMQNFEITVAIKGSGTADVPPEFGPLLRACGLVETVDAGVDVRYRPANDPNDYATCPAVTIYYYVDGIRYGAIDCRGNMSLEMPAGDRGMFTFSLMGTPLDPVDEALPSSLTLDPGVAPIVAGAGFTIGGFAAVIQMLSTDLQNAVAPTDSVNGAYGYGETLITDRDPAGEINPEQTLVATRDWWATWRASTAEPILMTIGSDAGNTIRYSAPAAVRREYNPGDRDGVHILDTPFTLTESSGDDQLELAFS